MLAFALTTLLLGLGPGASDEAEGAGEGEGLEVGEGPEPSARGRAPWPILLHVGGGFMGNLLPHPGGGGRLGVQAERGALRLGGRLSGWSGPGFRGPEAPARGGQLWAGAAAFMACGVPERHGARFPLCAEAGLGFMRGRGVGLGVTWAATLPWVWLGADANIEWWLGARERVALTMGVAILASLVRPAFIIAEADASYETPPVAARAQLGVVLRFGPRID